MPEKNWHKKNKEWINKMLALTRKKGESIVVGDNIEIVVLGITGEQVRLGIIAPKIVTVHRKEIYEQIRNENKEATQNVKEKMKAWRNEIE